MAQLWSAVFSIVCAHAASALACERAGTSAPCCGVHGVEASWQLDGSPAQCKHQQMSALSLEASIARAERRLRYSGRQARSDRGQSRLAPEVEAKLRELLLQPDKPTMLDVGRQMRAFCSSRGLRPIARASLYNALERVRVPALARGSLPEAV